MKVIMTYLPLKEVTRIMVYIQRDDGSYESRCAAMVFENSERDEVHEGIVDLSVPADETEEEGYGSGV